jgi:hypothetical protein
MTIPDRPFRTERIVASLMVRQSCGCPADELRQELP